MATTNSSRRFYRNYEDLSVQTSLLIPGDPANPGVFPVEFVDNAPAIRKTRATWTSATGITYPEVQTVSNLRYSYDANGIGNGWVVESAPTNYCIQGETFVSPWVATNATLVMDAVGPDGLINSAGTLRATIANATLLQTRSVGVPTGNRQFAIWVKRKTGTGAVRLTVDNSAFTPITTRLSTTEWRRFVVTLSTAVTSATFGISLSVGTDEVYVYGPTMTIGYIGSTSLSNNTAITSIQEYVEQVFPGTYDPQTSGTTIVARIKLGTREAGFYGTSAWQNSTESNAVLSILTYEGETGMSMNWNTDTSTVSIAAFDSIGGNVNAINTVTGSLINATLVVAMSHKDGQIRIASNINEPIVINDASYEFNRDAYGVFLTLYPQKGSCYVEYLAGWSYYIDDVASLVQNYK